MRLRRAFIAICFCSSVLCLASISRAQVPVGPLIVSGYVQSDGLFAVSDDPFEGEDSFRIQRARFSARGNITERVAWETSLELTSSPVLRDAFVTFKAARWAHVLAGQYVTPFSLERLTSTARLEAIDRPLQPLTPSRDIGFGVQSGEPLGGWLTYGVAVVNGVAQNKTDDNSAKDVVARVSLPVPGVRGLTVGVNGTTGEQPDGRRNRYGGDVELKAGASRLVAEFVRESREALSDREGLSLLAVHRRGAAELVARLTRLEEDGARRRRVEVGGNYYFAGRTRLMGALVVEPDRPGSAVGVVLRAQFAF